jgi:hypothetical protein
MTNDLFLTALVTAGSLIALDVLVFLARKRGIAFHLPFQEILTRTWFAGPQQTKPPGSLPAAEGASQPAESVAPAEGRPVQVQLTVEVPVGAIVQITLTTGADGLPVIRQNTVYPKARGRFPGVSLSKAAPERLNLVLFLLALLVYLVTRFIGLTDFPIYFFGDEAVQTVSAAEMISRGWTGPNGQFLPTYFQNGSYFNLSASVYAQVLPYLLFGKSVLVTRGTSVLITLLAALAVGLILREAFHLRRWWLGTLLLSITPAWFLHSRTAFETAIFVSFYATFLYFYLRYRLKDARYLYPAAALAALAFYAYSPGQLVLATTVLLLFLSDIQYHWQNRGKLLGALALLAVLALPYLRFRLTQSYSPLDHLRQLGSYWILPIPLSEKILDFIKAYLYGLSPQYWFLTGTDDLTRHLMKGYGHLAWWTFPLFLLGLILTLRKIRSSEFRTILLALLAAPTGAALAEIGITRVLVFVVPAALLTALGLEAALKWLEEKMADRWVNFSAEARQNLVSLALFAALAGLNFTMLNDALTNGPTWYTDYGLYGMQYGARQIFEQTVLPQLKADPKAQFVVSPSWANGTEEFTSFFIPSEYLPRVHLGQVYDLIANQTQLEPNFYFIVTAAELEKIQKDPKFKNVQILATLPLPTGDPGFYTITLAFSENIAALLEQQKAELRKPVEDHFEWQGQTVRALHSPFGGGQLIDMMDGRPETLAKTQAANPFLLDYYFQTPVPTSGLSLQTGSMSDFTVTVRLYAPGASQPVEYVQNFQDRTPDPVVSLTFPNGPATADHVYLEIKSNNSSDTAQIHVREITFK